MRLAGPVLHEKPRRRATVGDLPPGAALCERGDFAFSQKRYSEAIVASGW